jgi:hypothetical protein
MAQTTYAHMNKWINNKNIFKRQVTAWNCIWHRKSLFLLSLMLICSLIFSQFGL